MDTPSKVYDNLQRLLTELQKIKDLNNLANEYKIVSANLILSLQDYLKDSRVFSDSFNKYLTQTNKSVEATKDALNNTIKSVDDAIQTFSVTDHLLTEKMKILENGLNQLNELASKIESSYTMLLSLEHHVKDNTESLISNVADKIGVQNDKIIAKADSLLQSLTHEISQANLPLIERINATDEQFETLRNYTRQIEVQIQTTNQQILDRIKNLNSINEQRDNLINHHQNQSSSEHKSISDSVADIHKDLIKKISQSEESLIGNADKKIETINERAQEFKIQIQTKYQQILDEIKNLNSIIEQRDNLISHYQNQLASEHNGISEKVTDLHKDLIKKISQSEESVIGKTDKKIETINECAQEFKIQIQARDQQILENINHFRSIFEQKSNALELHHNQLSGENKEISGLVTDLRDDMSAKVSQSKEEIINAINSNGQAAEQHLNGILGKIGNTVSYEKVTIVLLLIIIVLELLFKF